MRRALVSLGVAVMLVGLAPPALANVELVARPTEVNFGRVSIDCPTGVGAGPEHCPKQRVVFRNVSSDTWFSGNFSVCGTITDGCVTNSPRQGWGGVAALDDPYRNTCLMTGPYLNPIEPGESCWMKITGRPKVKGKVSGYFVVRDIGRGLSFEESLLAVIPVTVVGVT